MTPAPSPTTPRELPPALAVVYRATALEARLDHLLAALSAPTPKGSPAHV